MQIKQLRVSLGFMKRDISLKLKQGLTSHLISNQGFYEARECFLALMKIQVEIQGKDSLDNAKNHLGSFHTQPPPPQTCLQQPKHSILWVLPPLSLSPSKFPPGSF